MSYSIVSYVFVWESLSLYFSLSVCLSVILYLFSPTPPPSLSLSRGFSFFLSLRIPLILSTFVLKKKQFRSSENWKYNFHRNNIDSDFFFIKHLMCISYRLYQKDQYKRMLCSDAVIMHLIYMDFTILDNVWFFWNDDIDYPW